MPTPPVITAPFVVFGPSKSGTTWVQKMLDIHPEVSCEFQPGLLGINKLKKAHAPGVTRANTTPYGGVFPDRQSEETFLAKTAFLGNIAFLRPDYPDSVSSSASEETLEALRRTHRTMVKSAVKGYLDESTDRPIKGYKMHVDVDFLIELFPQARVIFIVRDGRDVCVSMRHHRLRQGVYYNGDERWGFLRVLNKSRVSRRLTKSLVARFSSLRNILFRDLNAGPLFCQASLEKAAQDWNILVDYILDQCDKHPENKLLVRYEDLLARPAGTLAQMLDFIGADSSDSVVQTIVEQTSISKLKGKKEDGFFRKGISGDWRNVFTVDDIAQFRSITGDRLTRLGYETSNDWTL